MKKNKIFRYFTLFLISFALYFFATNATKAYSVYPGVNGGSMNYNVISSSYGAPNSTNLGNLEYLENLFEYSKYYYSSFSSLGTFEDFSHIAITYIYRPSQNENRAEIWFSYDPIINKPNVSQNSTDNTFTGTGAAFLSIIIDNYTQTATYRIYYDFTSTQYISMHSSIISLQGGTIYGYLSDNNTYSNSIISDYYTMKTLSTLNYFGSFYNPDLLENDPRFKKVCVNNQRSLFSVIPDSVDFSDSTLEYSDFMFVPSFVRSMEYGSLYYNVLTGESNLSSMSDYNGDLNILLYQYDMISAEYLNYIKNTPEIVRLRQLYGDLYSNLYGWAVFPLRFKTLYESDGTTLKEWGTFTYLMDSAYTEQASCDTVIIGGSSYCEESGFGGGGRDLDEILPITADTCFYIPVNYTLKLWNENDFGDISDTITIDNTNFSINSDLFEDRYNEKLTDNTYSGYIGYFKYLLKQCATPLTWINVQVTRFFNRLPLLVRYLIISGIVIILLLGVIKYLTGGK